jgi:quercetin dioxygenase-like cupin family protein
MAGEDESPIAAAQAAMPDHGVADRLSFLGRGLPPEWELRVVSVAPGGQRPYDENEWRDALVVVESGEIELECSAGGRRRFGAGSILWLFGLELRTLHNRGDEPALVVAVSRRR